MRIINIMDKWHMFCYIYLIIFAVDLPGRFSCSSKPGWRICNWVPNSGHNGIRRNYLPQSILKFVATMRHCIDSCSNFFPGWHAARLQTLTSASLLLHGWMCLLVQAVPDICNWFVGNMNQLHWNSCWFFLSDNMSTLCWAHANRFQHKHDFTQWTHKSMTKQW